MQKRPKKSGVFLRRLKIQRRVAREQTLRGKRAGYLPASDSGAFSSPLKRIEMSVVTPRSCMVTP